MSLFITVIKNHHKSSTGFALSKFYLNFVIVMIELCVVQFCL